jgi:hypothetical protein
MRILRGFVGFLLLIAGLAIVMADVHVAYLKQDSAHAINLIVGVLIAFGGGYVMMPTLADAFADAVVKRIPKIAGLWPGGMRRSDPPADPNVPPPPSITGGSGQEGA